MDNRLAQLLQIKQPQQPQWMQQLDAQNFRPQDSIIASTINHPLTGIEKALQWIEENMHTAAGMPQQDEGDIYGYAHSPEKQAEAGINLAGMVELGSMPGAPIGRGGTLGTTAYWNKNYADDMNTGFQGINGTWDKNLVHPGPRAGNPLSGINQPNLNSLSPAEQNKLLRLLSNYSETKGYTPLKPASNSLYNEWDLGLR
jgi:hypothetical protein